mmetsp:Transcript_92308/g.166732  ORF Transcript_92308/g.166732 Transcript_92308/m.166732 type:complete len:656 (-) Transcript_92308:358-2325(-)
MRLQEHRRYRRSATAERGNCASRTARSANVELACFAYRLVMLVLAGDEIVRNLQIGCEHEGRDDDGQYDCRPNRVRGVPIAALLVTVHEVEPDDPDQCPADHDQKPQDGQDERQDVLEVVLFEAQDVHGDHEQGDACGELVRRAEQGPHRVDGARVRDVQGGHGADDDLKDHVRKEAAPHRGDLLDGLAQLADEDALDAHPRIQSRAGETHHEDGHDGEGGLWVDAELLQERRSGGQETGPIHAFRVDCLPRPRGADDDHDQRRETGLAHHRRVADDPSVPHLVELLRGDPGAHQAVESARRTAGDEREHVRKNRFPVLHRAHVLTDGVGVEFRALDDQGEQQRRHDDLQLVAVEEIARLKQKPDRDARCNHGVGAKQKRPKLHRAEAAIVFVFGAQLGVAPIVIHRISAQVPAFTDLESEHWVYKLSPHPLAAILLDLDCRKDQSVQEDQEPHRHGHHDDLSLLGAKLLSDCPVHQAHDDRQGNLGIHGEHRLRPEDEELRDQLHELRHHEHAQEVDEEEEDDAQAPADKVAAQIRDRPPAVPHGDHEGAHVVHGAREKAPENDPEHARQPAVVGRHGGAHDRRRPRDGRPVVPPEKVAGRCTKVRVVLVPGLVRGRDLVVGQAEDVIRQEAGVDQLAEDEEDEEHHHQQAHRV